LFITTANWLDPIQSALRDRLEVITLPSYTLSEKLQIARRFLVPRQLEEHGLPRKRVRFPDLTLRKLVTDYTHEAGVRQLEREIGTITRKAVRKILAYDGKAQPITVAPSTLVEFLGQPKFVSESAEKITEYGIALGLAWTPVGGEILFIEATRMPGTGRLTLTGSLGDVMKESAQTALSYLRSQASVLNLKFTEFDKFDVHVHVPAGATPKDGPSAGSTIVVALASLFSHRLVRSEVAMTGEISLRGRILRVGGIKEKVLAATRSGVKEVILPEQNKNDWVEIPDEVRRKMKVHFVSHISDLIKTALRPK
jgi:ATP-dependent Lon protease